MHPAQQEPSQNTITIIFDEAQLHPGEKAILADAVRLVRHEQSLDPVTLRANLQSFCHTIGAILSSLTTSVPSYELSTIDINVTVGAEGQIKLIGGIKGEISGGIRLVFSRQA